MILTLIFLASLLPSHCANQRPGKVISTAEQEANNKEPSPDPTRGKNVEEEMLEQTSRNRYHDGFLTKRDKDVVTKKITPNNAAEKSQPRQSSDVTDARWMNLPVELLLQESTHSGSPFKNQLKGK